MSPRRVVVSPSLAENESEIVATALNCFVGAILGKLSGDTCGLVATCLAEDPGSIPGRGIILERVTGHHGQQFEHAPQPASP
jgi:hypothetical protein